MPIVEHLMRPGSGTIMFVPDVPVHVTEQVRRWVDETNAGPGAHVVITPSPIDPVEAGDAGMLAAAIWSGPIVARRSRWEIEVAGNGAWLDTYLDTDTTETAATPATWVAALARNGITAGTDFGGGSAITRTFLAHTITARDALDTVARLGAWEYEIRPDFTIDHGSAANLFRQAGDYGTVVVTATAQGPDAALRGVEGGLVDQALTGLGPQIPTDAVSLLNGLGGTANVVKGTATRTLNLKTPTGGTPDIVAVFNAPSEDVDNATLTADTFLDLQGNQRELAVQSATPGVRRLLRPGDEVYAYDLAGGIYVTTFPVQFRGEYIAPVVIRLTSMTWPIDNQYGVYIRSNAATPDYVDVTRWLEVEPPDAFWTVGDWRPDITGRDVLIDSQSYSSNAGAWQSFTPVWNNLTVGNATNTGQWRYENGSIHIRVRLVWGSTTSASGTVTIDLPASLAGRNDGVPSLGTVRYEDV